MAPITLELFALTVWQPWASLIIAGAKPFEFRTWDYRTRFRRLEGRRIVIHAGTREVKGGEVAALLDAMRGGERSSLYPEIALPILEAAFANPKGMMKGVGLGTVTLGKPREVTGAFGKPDSDRVEHHMWAWPMGEPRPFKEPAPCRGAQMFWRWPWSEEEGCLA